MDRVELTIDMAPDMVLDGPGASTPVRWIAMGLGSTLDDAAFAAMEGMIALLGRLQGWDRTTALALCSVAVNLRIPQMVNQVMGVHAVLAAGALG
jgi:acetamidase/formamidase